MTENDLAAVEDNSEIVDATTLQSNNDQSNSTSIPKDHVTFSNLTNDESIWKLNEHVGCSEDTLDCCRKILQPPKVVKFIFL